MPNVLFALSNAVLFISTRWVGFSEVICFQVMFDSFYGSNTNVKLKLLALHFTTHFITK